MHFFYFELSFFRKPVHTIKFRWLYVRHLSCYCCDNCLNGAINECDKTLFIGDSKRVKMIQNDNSNSEINEVQCNTNDNTIEDIVEKGMIIAVLADDDNAMAKKKGDLRCFVRVSRSCSTYDTRRVDHVSTSLTR